MPEAIDPNQIEAQFAGETVDDQPRFSNQEQAHLDEIKRKRQDKFAKMGVKTIPQQQIMESATSSSHSGGGSVNSLNARDRINAIKQGMMKGKMRELQEAKSPNEKAHDANWMERDMKKKQQEARRKAMGEEGALRTPEMTAEGQKLKDSGYKSSSELDNIESMFTGGGSGPSRVGDAGADAYFNKRREEVAGAQPQHHNQPDTTQQLINEDSFGGNAGSWEEAFRAKKEGWGGPQGGGGNSQPPQVLQEQRIPTQNYQETQVQAQPQIDLYQINQLIEKTVDNRVKEVLSELYSKVESNKNALTYKKVKGKGSNKIIKDVIVIEGKYYKITELNKNNS